MICVVASKHFRFLGPAWWDERSVRCPIPRYRIDRRPDDALEYGTDVESIVCRMVERVVERFDPISVWLFGSMASGDCNKHSDVDLMIIMPEGTDHKTAELGIMAELRGSMLPKDVLVDTPDTFGRAVDDLGTVQHVVRKHGVMLYG